MTGARAAPSAAGAGAPNTRGSGQYRPPVFDDGGVEGFRGASRGQAQRAGGGWGASQGRRGRGCDSERGGRRAPERGGRLRG